MWDRLSPPWQACVEQAWIAYCGKSLPIGAVVADKDGKILSVGRNRIYDRPGGDPGRLKGMPLAHAEMNALIALDYEHINPRSAILYTTSEPCPLCIGGLYMSGVGELRYASRDPYTGSVELLEKTDYLRLKKVQVIGPEDPAFEHLLITWLVEHKMQITDKSYKKVIDTWENTFPIAVEDGRKLYEAGVLNAKCRRSASAHEFLDHLEEFIANS